MPYALYMSLALVQRIVGECRAHLGVNFTCLLIPKLLASLALRTTPNLYTSIHKTYRPVLSSMNECFANSWRSHKLRMAPMCTVGGTAYDCLYRFFLEDEFLICGNRSKIYQRGFSGFLMIAFACLRGTSPAA